MVPNMRPVTHHGIQGSMLCEEKCEVMPKAKRWEECWIGNLWCKIEGKGQTQPPAKKGSIFLHFDKKKLNKKREEEEEEEEERLYDPSLNFSTHWYKAHSRSIYSIQGLVICDWYKVFVFTISEILYIFIPIWKNKFSSITP
jgi:hypothetical protein